jgi:osmoprotectant transport system ATP-binding protein
VPRGSQQTEETMIRLDGVGKTYPDGTVAVRELDLDVPRGSVTCLVGPSGCGKSTTLKMVNRLIEPTTGTIMMAGEDITHADPVALRRRIGYVIQQVGLFPHQTIRANVATVPHLIGWDKRKAQARAEELMELVGLDPEQYADRYPHQLSGGQRQRVGVARALAADPPVLLMDEPFGAVDPVVRARLQEEFLRLQRDLHKTVMLVTHDIDEAVKMGDRVAVFDVGGRLAQYDVPAQILGRPADDFVAEFVGASRGLRRLSVTPIDPADLSPVSAQPPAQSIPVTASLEEALAAMMRHDDAVVAMTDETGRTLGVLTPNGVHAALRRSVAQTPHPVDETGAAS